jgi:hypothetical protein
MMKHHMAWFRNRDRWIKGRSIMILDRFDSDKKEDRSHNN